MNHRFCFKLSQCRSPDRQKITLGIDAGSTPLVYPNVYPRKRQWIRASTVVGKASDEYQSTVLKAAFLRLDIEATENAFLDLILCSSYRNPPYCYFFCAVIHPLCIYPSPTVRCLLAATLEFWPQRSEFTSITMKGFTMNMSQWKKIGQSVINNWWEDDILSTLSAVEYRGFSKALGYSANTQANCYLERLSLAVKSLDNPNWSDLQNKR